jgi:rhodanese-related sulfurtransferase
MDRLPEFVANHPLLVAAFVALSAALAWSFLRARFQGYQNVEPADATQLINHKDAVVVDVRESNELADGRILDSVHVPLGQLKDSLNKLEKHKGRPVITVCRTGSRSGTASAALVKNGFEEVYNLKGGIMAWQGAGLPLKKSKK